MLEPERDSLASGFYGTSLRDYGAREVFEEYVSLFGEEAAGEEIMNYLETGDLLYFLPNHLWPDSGWSAGATVVRYEVGSAADPVVAWGFGEKQLGMLVFDEEGRFMGPSPFFYDGPTGGAMVSSIRRALPEGE